MADRSEYRREWNRKNRDKLKQYRLNSAVREIIEQIKAGTLVLKQTAQITGKEHE